MAALGNASFAGINEEACLYRALPPNASPNAAIERLGLVAALQSPPIDKTAIVAIPPDEPIPLNDLALRNPGRFGFVATLLVKRYLERRFGIVDFDAAGSRKGRRASILRH
ncbi:hypothetical protein [Bradyrhizobium sp. USDA 10063]